MANFLQRLLSNSQDVQVVDEKNRFNYILQTMMNSRWKITLIVLLTFLFIVLGIILAIMFKVSIQESWKEMLLILLGAFVGNLNKVIDFYFSSTEKDKILLQKIDEEDGTSLGSTSE